MPLDKENIIAFERLFPGILMDFSKNLPYGTWVNSSTFRFHSTINKTLLVQFPAQDTMNIELEANISVRLIELPTNNAVRLHYRLENGASLQHLCLRSQSQSDFELQSLARLQHLTCGLGSEPTVHQNGVHLHGPHAELLWNECFVVKNDTSISTQIQIEHHAPHTLSFCQVRSCLYDASKFRFKGDVTVHPQAYDTQTAQNNLNYILSPHARVQSDPRLHIYNKKVQATHGSATQPIDTEALFYLQSRGLAPQTAQKLFLNGFLRETYLSFSDWIAPIDSLLEKDS